MPSASSRRVSTTKEYLKRKYDSLQETSLVPVAIVASVTPETWVSLATFTYDSVTHDDPQPRFAFDNPGLKSPAPALVTADDDDTAQARKKPRLTKPKAKAQGGRRRLEIRIIAVVSILMLFLGCSKNLLVAIGAEMYGAFGRGSGHHGKYEAKTDEDQSAGTEGNPMFGVQKGDHINNDTNIPLGVETVPCG
ncbi:hypothetical protein B0H17DRAFT_1145201 [Mycena rosella]|uniref:Uncharacterized protein n=1 Tax=Mycena rosella TaxID=1033263 RepID=A0AAD7CRG2_MYCRO|nr:hypothetical protein B0H17DRAFT_1145201 [Mycena rosella]